MRITLTNGETIDRPFEPENCAGHSALSIEMSSDDFVAMAGLAAKEPGEFQTAMFQLASRLPNGRIVPDQVDKIRLELTCGAYPEQYDAFLGERQVGYLRLRHGTFRVDFPDCGMETVLVAHPEGDGEFMDEERARYLDMAKKAIVMALAREKVSSNEAKRQPFHPYSG